MIRYGKTTQTAISAASRLAEVYESGATLSSQQIADSRQLSAKLVAKLMTTLSQAGLVKGARGPGGGYSLARPPEEISLAQIAALYERQDNAIVCPFGPNWCGSNTPCPLHEHYVAFSEQFDEWLHSTSLDVFAKHPQPLLQ